MEIGSKVCPSCEGKNDAVLKACWKCGAAFEEETGAKKKRSSRALPTVVTFAVAIVLILVFIPLSKSLKEFFSGGKGSGGTNVSEDQDAVLRDPSGAKRTAAPSGTSENKRTVPGGSSRTETYPVTPDIGGYNLLVTSLPEALASKEYENEYVEGLITAYLHAHDGSTLLEKNELMLQDQYRALEYKIDFKYSKDGLTRPFIRHAITTLIAGKAYTVSVNYSRGPGEEGAAMRKRLLDALPKF